MKNLLRILGMFGLILFAVSCGKNTDPSKSDLFVGTYDGTVSYSDSDDKVNSDDSSVTVAKVGSKYNFNFNKSGILMLKGVEFKEEGKNSLINLDFKEGLNVIKIDESSLYILYTKDGKKWTAEAKR